MGHIGVSGGLPLELKRELSRTRPYFLLMLSQEHYQGFNETYQFCTLKNAFHSFLISTFQCFAQIIIFDVFFSRKSFHFPISLFLLLIHFTDELASKAKTTRRKPRRGISHRNLGYLT